MKNELKPKEYKRFNVESLGVNDTFQAVLDMTIESLKTGRPPTYPDTLEGLEAFRQATIDYFQYVRDINANPDIEKNLIVDIEGWAAFTGLTRRTILTYEKQRKGEWSDFISQVKNSICAAKKELAFHGQIPQVVFMFDLTNNHSYVNSSEFRIEPISDKVPERQITLEEQIQQAGLVWNDEKGEYVPAIKTKGVLSE